MALCRGNDIQYHRRDERKRASRSLKLGARTRLALVVMLGVVVGLGFITIPRIVATPSHSLSATTTTGTTSTSGTTSAYNPGTLELSNSTRSQMPTETTINLTALSVLLSLIVVPALTLSLLTSTFVSRRARKGMEMISESGSFRAGSTDPSLEGETPG